MLKLIFQMYICIYLPYLISLSFHCASESSVCICGDKFRTQSSSRDYKEKFPSGQRVVSLGNSAVYWNGSCSRFVVVAIIVHTYIYTKMHACVHVSFIHTCIRTCAHTYIHKYMYTYMHTYMRTYIHTYIHTYTNTCIHTYTNTCNVR